MKKTLSLLLVLCGMVPLIRAQERTPANAPADTTKTAHQQYYDSKVEAFNNGISADSKKNFWTFLGAVGSVLDNTANGVTINPALDKIGFKKYTWSKNIQLNVTPVTKGTNFLKYDSLGLGFTWALINNYSKQQWQDYAKGPVIRRYLQLTRLLRYSVDGSKVEHTFPGAHRAFTPAERDAMDALYLKTDGGKLKAADLKDLPMESKLYILNNLDKLPGDLPDTIKKTPAFARFLNPHKTNYIISYTTLPASLPADETNLVDAVMIAEFNNAFSATDLLMKKKQQLTVAANTYYNFVTDRWQGIYIAPTYSNYIGASKKFSYTIKASYSKEIDTLTHNNDLDRQLLKSTGSLDWLTPWKNLQYANLSFLELKLAVEHDLVIDGQYAKEKKSALSPAMTVTLNITNQFSLPFSIKYDTKKANVFGFLSVQYAMGGSKSK